MGRLGKRILVWLAAGALIAAAAFVAWATFGETPTPELRDTEWGALAAPPAEDLAVYWVGHSLFNHRDPTVDDAPHLMEEVGRLAEAAGQEYDAFDHTLFGANLSLAVRGEAHSYSRSEPELAAKRETLRSEAERFDALVLTEGIPVRNAEDAEHSAYYAQALYCDLITRNPEARVYLYEGPIHLQASDPDGGFGPRDEFGWAPHMEEDREVWHRIADQASTGAVWAPGIGPRIREKLGQDAGDGCDPGDAAPILMIPAAEALAEIGARIDRPEPTDTFELEGGEPLTLVHFFQNPYVDWPEEWPLPPEEGPGVDEAPIIAELEKRHPEDDYDDVHPSRLGTYVAGLTAYAVLYRRSPVGLPPAPGLTEATAETLQRIVWQVVRSEPRTGVAR